jgi:hypothetical protein
MKKTCFTVAVGLASVKRGELAPQTTLNQFDQEEEEWTLWEKIVISAKVSWHPSDHAQQVRQGGGGVDSLGEDCHLS